MDDSTGFWTLPRGFGIDPEWFDHPSRIHGKGHTLRVMILAGSLHARLLQTGVAVMPTLYRDLMTSALIHDLGRRHDGVCLEHGRWASESKRGIAEDKFLGQRLAEDDWKRIAAAVEAHARPDPTPPTSATPSRPNIWVWPSFCSGAGMKTWSGSFSADGTQFMGA
ncbi:MAG: hypothetical protein NT061_12485 [Spirochaetes bacterium]|nr:hypothetical protein [Spirochaetota bacterium]